MHQEHVYYYSYSTASERQRQGLKPARNAPHRSPSRAAACGGFPKVTTHQSTWSRLFAHAIDLDAFEHLLTSFFLAQRHSSELPERGGIVLTLDGKTLRGTIPAGQSCGVHLLAASLPEQGIVLAQAPVERKENEIVVAPTLLARLPLAGVVVVGDALHAQRATCRSIVETNGDYRWLVDKNQPSLLWDISQLFAEPKDVPTVISLRDSVYPETIIDGGASPSLFQHPRSLPAHGMH